MRDLINIIESGLEDGQVQRELDQIPMSILHIDTMEMQGRDSLDFVDISKEMLRRMLREAYEMGLNAR